MSKTLCIILILVFNVTMVCRSPLISIFENGKSNTRVRKIKKQYSFWQKMRLQYVFDYVEKDKYHYRYHRYLKALWVSKQVIYLLVITLALLDLFLAIHILVYQIFFGVYMLFFFVPHRIFYYLHLNLQTKKWSWEM